MGKHIADTLGRAAGTSVLVEDGGEVLALSVIDKRGELHLALLGACLAALHIILGLGFCGCVGSEVGKDAAVNLDYLAVWQCVVFNLCRGMKRGHKT